MEALIRKIDSIKTDDDFFKIKLSDTIKDLILLLSIVSHSINIIDNSKKFIYDYLKLNVRRKLYLITNPALNEIEPEIWVKNYFDTHPKVLTDSQNFFRIDLPATFSVNIRNRLEKVKTIGGGTCLLHAVLLGLSPTIQSFSIEYGNFDREEFGNAYRLFLGSKNILLDLTVTETASLNAASVENPVAAQADSTKWTLPELDNMIAFKLLCKLKYNLIMINGTTRDITGSPYNKETNEEYIIIYYVGAHFELIIKKNTCKTIYNKSDLIGIFDDVIINPLEIVLEC